MSTRRRLPVARTATIWVALAALAAIAYGGHYLWDRHTATTGTPQAIPTTVETTSVEDPEEDPVDPACASNVAATEPKRIVLGSLKVEGCVQRVGLDQGGNIATPGNIHVAGWFVDSPAPGQPGLSIVVGHETGRYDEGVFDRIHQFEEGSTFTVETGDGTIERFVVSSVREHPADETMAALYDDAKVEESDLALITCSGDWNSDRSTRVNRIVVLATHEGDV